MDKFSRKIPQKDLRRLMDERKLSQKKVEKVDSPLAKYDSKGHLSCVICGNVIKSAALWKVHVNSKQHKHNVEEVKALNNKLINKTDTNNSMQEQSKAPAKTKKAESSSLKNSYVVEKLKQLNQSKELTSDQANKNAAVNPEAPEVLPESFFDDPVVDAKIRNVEYKDAQDNEWERFQREIKEESVASNMIIAGEQTVSAVEREIIEINEQIHNWSKVLDLEVKVERLNKAAKRNADIQSGGDGSLSEDDEDEGEDQNVNDYLDWRSKSFI